MELEATMLVAIILIILGAVYLLSGFKKIGGFKKTNPLKAVAVGGIVICAGAVIGGWATFTWPETAPAEIADTIVADFDYTPTVVAGNGQLNSGKDTVTIGLYANTTAHTIAENDNTTWVETNISFCFKPEPFLGADDDDLAVLYYKISNPDLLVDSGSSSQYYVLTKSGGYRQAQWRYITGGTLDYVEGYITMKMTETRTLHLYLDIANTDMSYIQNTYDPQRLIIEFSNKDGSWVENFYVDYTCIVKHN